MINLGSVFNDKGFAVIVGYIKLFGRNIVFYLCCFLIYQLCPICVELFDDFRGHNYQLIGLVIFMHKNTLLLFSK